MEEIKKVGPLATGLKWGIIGGIVLTLGDYLTNLGTDFNDIESVRVLMSSTFKYVLLFASILFVLLAQLEHKKRDLGGFMGYGRAVGVSAILGIGLGVCFAIYSYMFYGFLHPEILAFMPDIQMEAAAEYIQEGQEDTTYAMYQKMAQPGLLAITSFFSYFFIVLISGLIIGIFVQKSEQ